MARRCLPAGGPRSSRSLTLRRHVMKLEGRVAIVTGGAKGLGRGIALCFADEGADIAIVDVDDEGGRACVREIEAKGRRGLFVAGNVAESGVAQEVVKQTLGKFGHVDILVNNANAGRPREAHERRLTGARFVDMSEEEWDFNYEGSFKTQVLCSQAVVPHMRQQQWGRIINISSVAAKVGDVARMPYSAAKGAVLSFTKALAREVAKDNITVNAICPGLIYTPGWQMGGEVLARAVPVYREKGMSGRDVFLRYVEKLTPTGREQTAEDIGWACVFFASEGARNITGQSLNVDGGQVMD